MPLTAPSFANRRGIIAMCTAMACFVTNDALVKYTSESMASAQLIFIRGLFATALLLAVATAQGALTWPGQHARCATHGVRHLLDRRVLLRAGLDAFATVAYLTALFNMQIGNATAINMAAPLFITLMAVLALGEKVSAARWWAVACGFVGVLLIVQPAGDAFNAWALLCLLGTLAHAGRDLMTRVIDKSVPSILITLATAVAVTVLAAAWTAFQGWHAPSARQLALLAAASVFLSGGYYLIIVGMREGEMSVIAPFRYTGLLYALLVGWVVWRNVPNALAWCGIVLLMGAGLYILRNERNRARVGLEAATD